MKLLDAGQARALQAYLVPKNIQHTVRKLAPDRLKDFWR
jgi:hypothetical protein